MGNGHNQLDVSHPLAPDLLFCHFHTAPVANDSFITDPLVFSAMTFPILYRSKNAFTEQAITFRFIGPVVDGFGL